MPSAALCAPRLWVTHRKRPERCGGRVGRRHCHCRELGSGTTAHFVKSAPTRIASTRRRPRACAEDGVVEQVNAIPASHEQREATSP
jgi:hypothetical protein